MKLKKYQKKYNFSYSYGIYPTLDLLKCQKEHVLEVLFESGYKQNPGAVKIKDFCKKNSIKIRFNDRLIQKLSVKGNTYAIGVFKKYGSTLEKEKNHLVLHNPGNMGNLGTIIRTMVGFNMNNLAIIAPGADVFDPKVVRGSMGAFFQINFEYFNSLDHYKNTYKNNFYPFVLKGKNELSKVKFKKPFSLVFGNEGAGLPSYYDNTQNSVYIKHTSKIDSLNLAVAVSLALYRAGPRRGPASMIK